MSRLRFKLCKIWNCPVDDPIFMELNVAQWRWYAHMFSLEEEESFKRDLNLVEHLAQFWNPEAVNKIRKMRASKEEHAFMNDKDFEESVLKEDYKNNPIIKALQKIRQDANLNNKDMEKKEFASKKIKPPIDLDSLANKTKF